MLYEKMRERERELKASQSDRKEGAREKRAWISQVHLFFLKSKLSSQPNNLQGGC